jgi:hypothetical protein
VSASGKKTRKPIDKLKKVKDMPETPKAQDKPIKEAAKEPKAVGMGIRLAPVHDSDQPVVANYTGINLAPGMAFIDFGFLEPAMLAALPRVAKEGGKLPERLNGKLAVRVAMGYDAMANLHQQLGRVLAGLSDAAEKGRKGGG